MAELFESATVWLAILLLHLSIFTVQGSKETKTSCTDIEVHELSKSKNTSLSIQDRYCIKGDSAISPFRVWSNIQVKLDFDHQGSKLYQADSCEALQEEQDPPLAKRLLLFVAGTDSITSNRFQVSPFRNSCFNIEVPENQSLKTSNVVLTFTPVYWMFPLSFLFGLILFRQAETLSGSASFYYSSGIVLGVGFSLLLVVFLLHRLVPSRAGAYTLLAGGWSISLYFLQWSWNNLVSLVLEKNPFVIGYFTIAGLISFCLCYYNGPVTNQRGINLIRWTIQLIATYFIYKGVQPESLSVAVVMIVYIYSFASSEVVHRILNMLPEKLISYRLQYYLFPPKTQFLTEQEYETKGVTETRKALMELRAYCSSPECDAWKVINRVQNPKRFSSFVTEGMHINDEEYEQFEDNPFEYPAPEDIDGCDEDSND